MGSAVEIQRQRGTTPGQVVVGHVPLSALPTHTVDTPTCQTGWYQDDHSPECIHILAAEASEPILLPLLTSFQRANGRQVLWTTHAFRAGQQPEMHTVADVIKHHVVVCHGPG